MYELRDIHSSPGAEVRLEWKRMGHVHVHVHACTYVLKHIIILLMDLKAFHCLSLCLLL